MALADPQSITPTGGTLTSLPRVEVGSMRSVYKAADGATTLTISHNDMGKGRYRHLVRVDYKAVAPDPFSSANTAVTGSVYVVLDIPAFGLDAASMVALLGGLKTLLSDATATRICQLES